MTHKVSSAVFAVSARYVSETAQSVFIMSISSLQSTFTTEFLRLQVQALAEKT